MRVGAVSYLNTKPLLYGIEKSGLMANITLSESYPSLVATQLLNNDIDVGLVPVAIIPQLANAFILTNYCIGCEAEVASVCIFSDVPLGQVERVLLDYQSRTSVALTKILLKKFWKISPILQDAHTDFTTQIKGTTAGVVIGDRAFEQRLLSPYIYDLGLAWKQYSGLPFVFAAWVANKQLPANFITHFNLANAYGVQHIAEVIKTIHSPFYDIKKYFTQNISYALDDKKKEGMKLFLSEL